MSTVEFLLVIALGSAVGDAMFYPEVPLLHAMLVITLVVLINKALDALIYRFRGVEKALDGLTAEALRDGVIVVETLRRARIGKSELFEVLRQQGLRNLGEVRRGYVETSGKFTFFRAETPVPGLQVEPPWDVCPPAMRGPGTPVALGDTLACCDCGSRVPGPAVTPAACPVCDGTAWTRATLAGAAGPG
jgi:uncharacterized membrane protein YcaP (DUF421 family)